MKPYAVQGRTNAGSAGCAGAAGVRPVLIVNGGSLMPTLPRKQSVNVSIDSALLREARAMRLNLSKTLEERLAELVRHTEREQWLKKNREALEDYNQRIEQAGGFSDGVRPGWWSRPKRGSPRLLPRVFS